MTTTSKRGLLEALDAATAPTATHSVYLDGAAWSRSRDLRAKIREAKLAAGDGLKSDAPRLQAELDQVQEQIRASELVFTFTALPRTVYSKLLDEFPSPDPALAWNPDTFPPALVAAACIGISGVYEANGLTLEEVTGLYERLSSAQTDELFRTAFQLQVEVPKPFTLPAGDATGVGGPNSNTATTTESDIQSF